MKDNYNHNLIFSIIFIIILLAASIMVMPYITTLSFAKTSIQLDTTSTTIQNIEGPVKISFVNSYWTDNIAPEAVVAGSTSARTTASDLGPVVKQEVGPGEGPSTLAIVLTNRGFSNISGITGSLKLPPEFEPLITPRRSNIPGAHSQTALSSYDGVVSAGQTFTLYFAVDVLKDAQVGKQYHSSLKIGYFKVTEQNSKNSRSEIITVPFTLPGKVILDAVSRFSSSSFSSNPSSIQTLNLVPDIPNVVKLTIRNDGSANAKGVVITISSVSSSSNTNSININAGNASTGLVQQAPSSSTVNLGTKTFDIGTIFAGGTTTISPIIYPSISAAGTVQILNLAISYNDAYGNKKTSNQLIGLQILPPSPQPGLSVSPSPSSSSSFYSSSPTTRAAVAFPPFSSSRNNNSSTNIDPKTSSPLPSSNASPSLNQITAGKIQDLKFTINNDNDNNIATTPNSGGSTPNSITELAVSLVSQSSSVKILGPSSWNLQSINPRSGQELSTQVFASTSVIGSPIFFTVTIQYIQNGHQLKTASFDLGAIVIGDIKISVDDLDIRYIGDTPYLVGNLLNQGNTPALFTSVEMLKQRKIETQQQQSPPSFSSPSSSPIKNFMTTLLLPISSQYIGDLAVNSPLSFRIPLKIVQVPTKAEGQNANSNLTQNATIVTPTMSSLSSDTYHSMSIDNNTAAPGLYPVSLKITYSDDLKNSHELIINKSVSFDVELTTQAGRLGEDMSEQQLVQQQSTFANGFIDVYWAANTEAVSSSTGSNLSSVTTSLPVPPQQEVGPGDGQSILAIVLSNTGFSDINGIIGYLTLPIGFSAATSSTSNNQQQMQLLQQQPAIASFNNVVKAGQSYTLYFKVNILKTATIGTNSASLRIDYFKVPELEPGKYNSETFTIPFTLPGKVILDAVSNSTDLTPGVSNQPKIEIKNKGTADARSVIVTVTGVSGNSITGATVSGSASNSNNPAATNNSSSPGGEVITTSPPSPIPTVNLGSRTFNIGTIPVNQTADISPTIYPSDSAGGTLQNLNLQISYSDANGDTKSSDISVGFRILPTPPESGLSVTPSNTPSNTTTSSNINSNNNNNTSGISVTPSHTSSSNTNPSYNSNIAAASFPLQLHTIDVINDNNNKVNENNLPSNINNASLILVAGEMEDMGFNIANNNNFPITSAVISITSQSGDVKIIGDSLWSLQSLSPHSKHTFSTRVYASPSLIGNAISFIVTVQYISGGQSKIGSFNLGANVIGDIKISINDLGINYIAGTPNLVGNLLNQGNTIGLFTTVQLINQPFGSSSSSSSTAVPSASGGGNGPPTLNQQQQQHPPRNQEAVGTRPSTTKTTPLSSSSPPQYLGDLQPDSPLPFSIPLNIDNNNTAAPGLYPVSLKITYSDDLKNSHELIINQTVNIKAQHRQQPNDQGQNFFGLGRIGIFGIPFPIIIGIIAVIVIISVILIIRRRKSRAANLVMSENERENINNNDENDEDEDIESLIDEHRYSDKKKKQEDTGSIGDKKHGS